MKRWNQSGHYDTSYSCIEEVSGQFWSMLVVTNGASWAVDPDTEQRHSTFEEAAQACGLSPEQFELVAETH